MKYDFPDELNLKKFKIKSLLPDSTILCLGRRRCLLKNTNVIMHNGTCKKIQDIKVGDFVMGDDCSPRKVIECHTGMDSMYKITHLTDKKTYTVNSEHILVLKNTLLNKTIEISAKDFYNLDTKSKKNFKGINAILNFKDTPLDFCCYSVGVNFKNDINYYYSKIQQIKYNSFEKRQRFIYGLLSISQCSNYMYDLKFDEIDIYDTILYMLRSIGMTCIPDAKGKSIKVDFFKTIQYDNIHIERVEFDKYYGISIDGNNRYILGEFVITHNSGKSWLVRDILYNFKHIPAGIVFSGTEHASPFFSDFVPDSFIHTKYNPELIDQIMIKQRQKIRKAKEQNKGNNGKTSENNFFIILDDMLHEAQTWKRDETIKNIFFNGRHYNFMFFLTMQYPLGITPDLRSNIDYVFIFNEPSLKNRKKIYDDYASMIPDFTYFCNILDECTKNHQCLVIKTSGNGLQEQVFWYKAEFREDFRVGHHKIWEYHDKHYNPEYEVMADKNAERIHNITKKFNKTKKLKVIVSKTTGDIEDYHETDSE